MNTRHLLAALGTLVVVVIGIIAVAFRGSWGAFRDAALAIHFDRDSANLYPFAIDGLMVVAIVAAVLLRHNRGARQYCLWVIAGYTGASVLINYLHGIGMFAIDPTTGRRPVPPSPVVLLLAMLLVGSIFLGSHLLVHVWRTVFPDAPADEPVVEVNQPGTPTGEDLPVVPELPPPPYESAKAAYRLSLNPQLKTLSQQNLVDRYGISKRQAARVQDEVKAEREAEADQDGVLYIDGEPIRYDMNGHAPAATTGEPS